MKRFALAFALLATPAFAQQPDQATLQKIIQSLQAQRNAAMDAAALSDARAQQLAEEIQKLKADAEKAKPKE